MTLIQSLSNSPTYNLAFEEYLFTEFQTDFLLFYINEPCVIIGANQAVQNEVNIDYCRTNGIKIIRRKSGGGAVYHDFGNLNFSFISSTKADKSALSDAFLHPIVEVLSKLHVPIEIGKRKDLWLPDGFKVSGTASQIRKKRELHHGTLLIKTDLEKLELSLEAKTPDTNIKATPSVRSRTKNILDYWQEHGIRNGIAAFMQLLIETTVTHFDEKLIDNTSFDQKSINFYETTYLSDEWNFKTVGRTK